MSIKTRIERLEEAIKPKGDGLADLGIRLQEALERGRREEREFQNSLNGLDESERAKRIEKREEQRRERTDELIRRFRGKENA